MDCVCKDGERERKTYSKSQKGGQRAPFSATNCMRNQAWPCSQRVLCAPVAPDQLQEQSEQGSTNSPQSLSQSQLRIRAMSL